MTKSSQVSGPDRRRFLGQGILGGVASAAAPFMASGKTASGAPHAASRFELNEITLPDLASGMKSGKFTAHSLARKYLDRIHKFDPWVHAVIELNPDALAIADQMDRERKAGKVRGPLHGIPMLIKDNIATRDRMQTTAGSLALVGSVPPKDSFVAKQLRDAGAVILGKTNLSEWANIRSSHSSSGWSGRGDQTHNPYALDRNPSGSSSGSGAAVAANFCAVAIGTETNGSIISPSNANGLVGIKPTVGLVSRAGIVPISHSQDTAGPMARTVTDAAILLGALTGVDPDDSATSASPNPAISRRVYADYTQFLDPKGLAGARLGIARKRFGFHDGVDALMAQGLDALKNQGAVLIDPADITTVDQIGPAEGLVLQYELKADLNAYLQWLGPQAPVHSLQEIIDFNEKNRDREMPFFGQDFFIKAQEKGTLAEQEYQDALAKCRRLMRAEGIDAVMDKFQLDAIVAPTGVPAWVTDLIDGDHSSGGSSGPAAIAGYPHITVPLGFFYGMPVGISFFGRAWSEPALIRIAYAFEQATKQRRSPKFLPAAT